MNWQAKWIWAKSHADTPNFYMYARKEFEVESAPLATAYVTCSTEYKLYVNGRYVGRGPSACHPAFQYFDEYDLSHAIRPGRNVIGAICYNYGVGTHCRPQAPGGLLLQLEIRRNGDLVTIATDDTWRVKPGDDWDFGSARMFWTIGFQEVYDSRHKPVGWNVVGFDDSKWEEPEVIGEAGCEPWLELVPRQIPRLREWEVFPERVLKCGRILPVDEPGLDIATRMQSEKTSAEPGCVKYASHLLDSSGETALISPGSDRFIVLDFGREVVGFPVIRIRDGGRGTVDFGYSEALDDNGDVFPTRQSILQADRLILHGGRQKWKAFGRRAFRYMQLTFRDIESPIHVERVSVSRIGYPAEQVSSFECSDESLNEIWRIGVDTLSIGMQDSYEDCPLREHGQYPGDVRVQALINYYCFSDTRLVAKALRQFVQCQREDGLFNALWPSSTNHILPDYNLVWVMILHDYYLFTGDKELLRELYPNLRLLLEHWVRSQESENELLQWEPDPSRPMHEWWLFIDHAPLDKRGEVAAYNAFYYQALRDAAKLASALGEIDDTVLWHDRAETVLHAFNDRFWSQEKNAYVDCNSGGSPSETVSEQTNALAVLFGLADSSRCAAVRQFLIDARRSSSDASSQLVLSGGPYFNFYLLQAMARLGLEHECLDLIRSEWGEMLKRGATTWWETFDARWDDGAICPDSLCHPWSGAPTYFLSAEILGVKPSMPESAVVVIQPRVGDLEWAKGHIKTQRSAVDVEWHSEPDVFRIDIEAPEGYIVGLPIARFARPQIDEIDLSPETPERVARRNYGWGTVIWRDGVEHDPYVDWLATQESDPPADYRQVPRTTVEEGYLWVRGSSLVSARYEVRESPV